MQTFDRYSALKKHIIQISSVFELLLFPVQDGEVEELIKSVAPKKSVTVVLQRNEIEVASTRLLFAELLRQIEKLDFKKKYIHKNCDIARRKERVRKRQCLNPP